MSDNFAVVVDDLSQDSTPRYIPPSNHFVEFKKEEIEHSIPARFEQIVRTYPDRLAVKAGDRSLTYDRLNWTANRIARAILEKRGRGSEPIALLFEHGVDVIAAIFGVLKAGKFYLALSPSLPRERILYILEDAQAGLIVTNNRNVDLARALTTRALLNIDKVDDSFYSDNLDLCGSPDDIALIAYTSGSTGEPKGVVQSHRVPLYYGFVYAGQLYTSCDDRFTLFHSVSFASAEVNLYRSLLTGASLLPFDIKSEGIHRLASWLEEEQITICHLPPAVIRQLADSLSGERKLSHLRVIHLSGAPITQPDFELYKKSFPAGTLFAFHMGSTETGGICSAVVGRTFSFPNEGSPIGYPYPGKKVLLLDEDGHEVGRNEVGEIAVKSRYLSVGYWRRQELTESKFLTDPNSVDERIYLTGDLGRILPDGSFIHLGRKDFMVKIRGYRVEIGEIERNLLGHPAIKEAAVIARVDEIGEKHLVAYLVSKGQLAPSVSELRTFLKEKLPDYMIPSVFVNLDVLPLNANGKVDRQALPLPDQTSPRLETTFVVPRDALELQLTKMWERLLGIQPIGKHDNFFDLGGHSLLAARLVAFIEKAFGKHLFPTILLQAPTIEQLADILRQEKRPESWSPLVPIQPRGSKLPFFWIHGDSSDVFLPHYLGSDQPLYGLEHQSQDGKPALYTQVEAIAAHYVEEIRTVQPEGPYFLGGFSFGGTVAFEMSQQLKRKGEEAALLFLLDSHFPGDDIPDSPNGLPNISFRDEVHRHLCNLAPLGAQEKLAYILVRVRGKITEKTARISKILKKPVSKLCLAMGRRLPLSLRSYYILDIYFRARRNYVPQLYRGMAVYIKSEKRSSDHQLNWSRLFTGGLEVHEIPGDHLDLVKEPCVRVWAEKLKDVLQTAQRTANDSWETRCL